MTHYVNLIKRHKRTAATVALLGSTLMFSGCGEEPKAPIELTLGKVEKIDTNRVGNVSVVLFNKDRSVAYVKGGNGSISRVNVKDGIKAFSNNDNWKTLTLKNDSAADTVGLAKLNQPEPNPSDRKIFIAQKGLLVLAQLREAAAVNTHVGALAYFAGDDVVPTNAWVNNATHSDPAAFAIGQYWDAAHSVMKDSKELIVVASELNGTAAGAPVAAPVNVSSVGVGPNKFTVQYAKAGTAFAAAPKMASDKDNNVYFVAATGVSVLENSKLGATNPIPAETADAVADKWQITPGTANNNVSDVLSHDGKLFISLIPAGAANDGGIAVYDISGKKNLPPVAAWSGVRATNLHVADNNVQAVVNNNLINIKADGAPGDVVFAYNDILSNKFSKKSLLFGEDLTKPQYQYNTNSVLGGFTAAYKFGDNLLLESRNELWSVNYETKSVPASKLKNQPAAE